MGAETQLKDIKPNRVNPRTIEEKRARALAIVDFFCHSGSTIVAAHQLKRRCYAIEIEPKYCQIAIERLLLLDPNLKLTKNGQIHKLKLDNSLKTSKLAVN